MPRGGTRLDSLDEYRRAVEELERRLSGDPQAAALARELAKVLLYELRHRVADDETLEARLGRAAQGQGTRIALVSDIHGNHEGLLAALADIEREKCDHIVCLGDLVDGGPENEKVIETLRARAVPCVKGNHDQHNDCALSAEARAFLAALPERRTDKDVLYVHISPRAINRKIDHTVEAWNVFEDSSYRLVFVGHVHVPHIFGKRCKSYGEAERHAFEYNRPFKLSADDRYIVSVGSIGYGRDRVGKIRYCIYDRAEETVELRAIDGPVLPHDYARAMA